ncbi:hypothetical protein NL676_020480 [Syzygium grande]|nr:hypothetical protein NL676_020480 [Syzygium grande]
MLPSPLLISSIHLRTTETLVQQSLRAIRMLVPFHFRPLHYFLQIQLRRRHGGGRNRRGLNSAKPTAVKNTAQANGFTTHWITRPELSESSTASGAAASKRAAGGSRGRGRSGNAPGTEMLARIGARGGMEWRSRR